MEFLSLDCVDVHGKSHAVVFAEQLDAAAGFGEERRFANGKDRGVPDRVEQALDLPFDRTADVKHMAGVDGTFSNPLPDDDPMSFQYLVARGLLERRRDRGIAENTDDERAAGGSASAGHSVNFAKLKRNADRSDDAVAVWAVTGITAAIHTTKASARAGGSARATASSEAPEETDADRTRHERRDDADDSVEFRVRMALQVLARAHDRELIVDVTLDANVRPRVGADTEFPEPTGMEQGGAHVDARADRAR